MLMCHFQKILNLLHKKNAEKKAYYIEIVVRFRKTHKENF